MILPAPAKINLFLHIVGQRADGYHNLQTVFQFIDWCDYLNFSTVNDSGIHLVTEMIDVAHHDNLVVKAAKALQNHVKTSQGVKIILDKHLPIGAGIGGGSSNAATTLHALNVLWDLQLSNDELADIGVTLGADVPVFVHGFSAWAEGIGEKLTPMILKELWCLLLVPDCQVSTQRLFSDPRLKRDRAPLSVGDYSLEQCYNDFEPLARMEYPEIAHALDWLGQFTDARMTGTGAIVYGLFDTEQEASKIASRVPQSFGVKVVKTMNHSPLQLGLAHK